MGGAFRRCEKPPPPDAKILQTFENPTGKAQFVLAKLGRKQFKEASKDENKEKGEFTVVGKF